MADSLENKGSLAERLEEDRQQMAIRVSELKREYNVTDRFSLSPVPEGALAAHPEIIRATSWVR
jgi:hypothetical protein